jgi:hypothetical protein
MVTVIGGAAISIHWGIVGVAVTTAFAITVAFLGTSYLALQVSGLPVRELVRAHLPGFGAAMLVGAAVWFLVRILHAHDMSPPVVFAIAMPASVIVALVVALVGIAGGRGDFGWLKSELARFRKKLVRRRG